MKAYSPDGSPIRGTLERLYGVRPITDRSYRRDQRGRLTFDYVNGVEVGWGSVETVTVGTSGQTEERLFLDSQNRAWAESQIIVKE